jgi:hypothetical protein
MVAFLSHPNHGGDRTFANRLTAKELQSMRLFLGRSLDNN